MDETRKLMVRSYPKVPQCIIFFSDFPFFLLDRLFIIVNHREDGLVVLKVSSCGYYGI